MWKRSQSIKATIVHKFEENKVPCSHRFWLDISSIYSAPAVTRCLRQIITSRSDRAEQAVRALALSYLYGETALRATDMESYRKILNQLPTRANNVRDVLAAFGDPIALKEIQDRFVAGYQLLPLEVLALFRWFPAQQADYLHLLLQRAEKETEWLAMLGSLRRLAKDVLVHRITHYLTTECSNSGATLTQRDETLMYVGLLFGERVIVSSAYRDFLSRMSRRATKNVLEASRWSHSLEPSLDIMIYNCLSVNDREVVRKTFERKDLGPVNLAYLILMSYLSDRSAHAQWRTSLQQCSSSLRWLRTVLRPMISWLSSLDNTDQLDSWLDSLCPAVKRGIAASKTVDWQALTVIGELASHTSAYNTLLPLMVLSCPKEGVSWWLRKGVPDWDSDEGSLLFWDIASYLL